MTAKILIDMTEELRLATALAIGVVGGSEHLAMTVAEAEEIAGTLAHTSKMPCHSTSVPAKDCETGAKLVKVEGSVCNDCYALKGFYKMRTTQRALEKRLAGIVHPLWVAAMVVLITNPCSQKGKNCPTDSRYFRWQDSGDLQSLEHLLRIAEIARLTPDVKHWVPTREYRIVIEYRKRLKELGIEHPENLVIRLSAHMVDREPPKGYGFPTSTVVNDHDNGTCSAPETNNKCADCRACWNSGVENVAYALH